MRKKVFGIIMTIALVSSGVMIAQTQSSTSNKSECCKTEKVKKDAKKRGLDLPAFDPFNGTQITPDQQEKIRVLQEGLGPVLLNKKQMKEVYGNKSEKLSDEQKKARKLEMKEKKAEAKKKYLNGIKEILTPEQYVIFLENVYLYSPENQGSGMPGKDMKKGHHGMKGEKGKKDSKKTKES